MKGTVAWILSMAYTKKHGGGGGGTNDYNALSNRPKINNATMTGDKSGNDYGLVNQDDSLTTAQMNALLAKLD